MTTQVFQRGEVVPCWAEARNWEDTLINPSQGVKITIKKPDGTAALDGETPITDVAMTNPETGKYVYYYKSNDDDPVNWWHYLCKAADGSGSEEKVVITHGSFKLV